MKNTINREHKQQTGGSKKKNLWTRGQDLWNYPVRGEQRAFLNILIEQKIIVKKAYMNYRTLLCKQYSKTRTHETSSWELSKMHMCILSTSDLSEFATLSSISYCWQSFSSIIFGLLSSNQRLACSLNASPCMPAVVLYYCSFQGTIL